MAEGVKISWGHVVLLQGLAEFLELDQDYDYVPAFNAKRPLGNSGDSAVARDIADCLGVEIGDDDEHARRKAIAFLRECTPVLKYLLTHVKFDDHIGVVLEPDGTPTKG